MGELQALALKCTASVRSTHSTTIAWQAIAELNGAVAQAAYFTQEKKIENFCLFANISLESTNFELEEQQKVCLDQLPVCCRFVNSDRWIYLSGSILDHQSSPYPKQVRAFALSEEASEPCANREIAERPDEIRPIRHRRLSFWIQSNPSVCVCNSKCLKESNVQSSDFRAI